MDRLSLENKIHQICDRAWFFDKDDDTNWVKLEGMMPPDLLHLEDVKQTTFLESLRLDNTVTSDVTQILHEITVFFSDIYSKQDSVNAEEIDTFLSTLSSLPKVLDDTMAMTVEISEQEVEEAIKQLKGDKAPGSDGLTAAFYKHYQDSLVPIMCKVFNDAFENKTLTMSQCLAIVILLFKKGDPYVLLNYHPIS